MKVLVITGYCGLEREFGREVSIGLNGKRKNLNFLSLENTPIDFTHKISPENDRQVCEYFHRIGAKALIDIHARPLNPPDYANSLRQIPDGKIIIGYCIPEDYKPIFSGLEGHVFYDVMGPNNPWILRQAGISAPVIGIEPIIKYEDFLSRGEKYEAAINWVIETVLEINRGFNSVKSKLSRKSK